VDRLAAAEDWWNGFRREIRAATENARPAQARTLKTL